MVLLGEFGLEVHIAMLICIQLSFTLNTVDTSMFSSRWQIKLQRET